MKIYAPLLLLLMSFLMLSQTSSYAEEKGVSSVEQVIPITMANLRGQQALYKEGWFIVTSTEETLRYAKEKSIQSSGQALSKTLSELQTHSGELGQGVVEGIKGSLDTGTVVFEKGTALSGGVMAATQAAASWQLDMAGKGLVHAWDSFVLGNISLAERTQEDRDALRAIPGNYFSSIKQDFANVYDLSEKAADAITPEINVNWGQGFAKAQQAFDDEYEESGEESNALTGLFDIFTGYGKAMYYAVLEPSGKAAIKGVSVTASLAGKALFLPTAGVFILTGRTVQSAGLSLYYTTSTGIKLVSPTVESGLLAGLSLLSAGTVPVTYMAGGTVGFVNQVAVTTAAPVAATAQAAASLTYETAKYAGLVTYDVLKGGSTVLFNQTASGVALGYNALTALPTQAVLGTANAAFFLVYDGPRLLIAKVSGKLQSAENEHAYAVEDLPVGTVVDMKQLQAIEGITVESVSDDPAILEQVLKALPKDLRP